jgi:tRNA(fMet)-specific endonuclease VapC
VSRLLLDTSAISSLFGGAADVRDLLQEAEEVFLNPVVLAELKTGFRRGKLRMENERMLARLIDSPRVRLASIDEETSERYAVIFDFLRTAGTPIPTNDVWIAATAMQHSLQLVTRDAHFERVPQILTAVLGYGAQGPPSTGA